MHLLSPIWLIALIPWSGIAIWMLRGARESRGVPFLELWRGGEAQPRTHRRMKLPPTGVALALAAALLGILAAARPSFSRAARFDRRVVMVVDRGLSMSGRANHGIRFVEAGERAAEALRRRFGEGEVEVVSVPGGLARSIDVSELAGWIGSLSPTACDTSHALEDVIAGQDRGATVVVVSDLPVGEGGDRVIRVVPEGEVGDVGIAGLSVRDVPTTQAMVVVRNQSEKRTAVVRVTSGAARAEREVELPGAPGAREYFFDLPSVGDVVRAEVVGGDGNVGDDSAWVVRESAWPRVEARSALPAAVGRVTEAYGKARPGSDASRVGVVDAVGKLGAGERGVVVVRAGEALRGAVVAEDHAIARNVRWEDLRRVRRANVSPPEGWRAVVRAGGDVLVAVKESEPRQVWVGFDAEAWETTADFVVFWTNVLDWAGAGGAGAGDGGFVSHPLVDWTGEWKLEGATAGEWPGVYVRGDGRNRAFNPPDVVGGVKAGGDWEKRIANSSREKGWVELTSGLLLTALGCLLGAALVWRG
jgi:hypothetical protein